MEVVAAAAGHRTTGLAAVSSEPLSPPHSDTSEHKHVLSTKGDCDTDKPMDLSSGGASLGLTQLFNLSPGGAGVTRMPSSDHPLLNVRRLADLVRAQHRESEQRERESKRKWEDNDDNDDEEAAETHSDNVQQQPVDLIRQRWEGRSRDTDSPGAGPGSPAGSSSGSESGGSGAREEKRRRLDMLLNKKFDKVATVGAENIIMATPPPSEREPSPASDRRPSTDSTGTTERRNRRKQSQPSNPGSPPSISIRPNSDLFPPAATSTPRHKDNHGNNVPQDYSPARKMSRSHSPDAPKSPAVTQLFGEEKENKDALKNQLLQVCMQQHH